LRIYNFFDFIEYLFIYYLVMTDIFGGEFDNSDDEEEKTDIIYKPILDQERHIAEAFKDIKSLVQTQCEKVREIPLSTHKKLGDYIDGNALGWNQEILLSSKVSITEFKVGYG
jgi:hypothetical protein